MFQKHRYQKIKKSYIVLFGLLIGVGILLRIFELRFSDTVLSLKGEELHVLVAKSPKQWYRGLGQRESLGEYDGMLFVYSFEASHGIVMRDMKFPLDVVWLRNGKVVDIAPNIPVFPQDRPYIPREINNTVLELPAGWALSHGLKIGDSLQVIEKQRK
jgi:uncharacterized membrane protein (UPF0127 family)